MKNVIVDVETDGLLDTATRIHCMVLRDVDTDEVVSCCDLSEPEQERKQYRSMTEGLRLLSQAERVYFHNGIRFDRPAIKKFLGHEIPWEKIRDTFTIGAMRWTNTKELDGSLVNSGKLPAPLRGKQTLEAWGYRLGVLKGNYGKTELIPGKKKRKRGEPEDPEVIAKFKTWTKEMQDYCEQDTAVNAALVRHIQRFSPPLLAIETEQELCEYLTKQEENGWPFDQNKAIKLHGTLSARREELAEQLRGIFKPWWKAKSEFTPKRDMKPRLGKEGLGMELGYTAGCPCIKIELVHFNPSSRQQIGERLQTLYNWKPTSFTDGGQPEVNEDTLLSLPKGTPGVDLILEYLLVTKRLGQLAEGDNAWLKLATKDKPRGGKLTGLPHIHHAVLQSGTITHRCAHIWPNLGQVPKVGNPFGQECRELFHVPDGWVQVGADASGLELRELAHYMARFDGGAYGKTVTEGKNEDGTDIHSVNRDALGLHDKPGRDGAKTFIYTFLYGGGDLLLGQRIPPSAEEVEKYKAKTGFKKAKARLEKNGQPTDDYTVSCLMKGGELRFSFLKNLPALGKLVDEVKAKAKAQGFLLLHDGRRVPVRYQHAALNSLLQGSGSIVCKRWIVRFNRRLIAEFGEQGWDGKWAALGFIHDEVQLAVRPEIEARVRKILVEEIRAVGIEFNLRIPLDGEAKSGANWADCH